MDDEPLASVSARFHPDEPDMKDADLLLLATDAVFFYAHRAVLLRGSSNNFGGLVTLEHAQDARFSQFLETVLIDYEPVVLNVVLLAVYGFPMRSCDPTLETLCGVIPALAALGYSLSSIAAPQSELFRLFLEAAEGEPFWLYAIAAHNSFEGLAVAASTFTLKMPIMNLSDELAQQMGPIYLKRLLLLHYERTNTLKRLITPPPFLHPPTDNYPRCSSETQESIDQAWIAVSAYVIFQNDSKGMSEMIAPFARRVQCPECAQSLHRRVAVFVDEWSMVKLSI